MASEDISRSRLDKAGKIIRLHQEDDEYWAAIELLNRWREQHILPMDYYFDACNDLARKFLFKNTVVAERLKRLPTIIDKLDRFPDMRLSSMQDVGGVRVILDSMNRLDKFEAKVRELSGLKSSKDYLARPKKSGYRSRHLVFDSNSILIEVQLRTQLQHLWATAVETVDIISNTALKTGRSSGYWQNFFELVSSAFAYIENLPMLPQHDGWGITRLRDSLREIMAENLIEDDLKTFAATYMVLNGYKRNRKAYYAVVTFIRESNETIVSYYPENKYQEAVKYYELCESNANNDNVLVSVGNLKKLHDAYPNYFKDISKFNEIIKLMLDFRR